MSAQPVASLERSLRPSPVELHLEPVSEVIAAVERELRLGAIEDRDRCCGYFPTLVGMTGIRMELPACRAFVDALPEISCAGITYRFNFLRLSLVCQSADPAFHLDSDASTALTGDLDSLHEREVLRLLLNLSSQDERALPYLDVDPQTVKLVAEGAYVRAKDPTGLLEGARVAVLPPHGHDGPRLGVCVKPGPAFRDRRRTRTLQCRIRHGDCRLHRRSQLTRPECG